MNATELIDRLEEFFSRDDLSGAGEFLRYSRRLCLAEGDDSLLLTVLNEMMGLYRKTREEDAGLEAVASGISLLKRMGLADTVTGGTTYLNAATTMKAFGRAAEALPYYENAGRIYREKLSPTDCRLAGLANNAALALVDLHRDREAEEAYRFALSVLEKNSGQELDIANTYVNMAHLYEGREDYGAIEACLDKAWEELEKAARGSYYAYTCKKCAPSFGYFGYFAREKELNERAAAYYERD